MFTHIKSTSTTVSRRRRSNARRGLISYANVAATVAIVFSMSGGALAANHFLLSSTKQISPRLLHKLRGRPGPTGPQGPPGLRGATGATGKEGPAGKNLTAETPLQSGHSESGFYTAAGGSSTSEYIGTAISYVQPLSTAIPDTHVIWNKRGTTSTHCSGYGQADPGYLCLYDNEEFGVSPGIIAYSSDGFSSPSAGVILYWVITASGSFVSGEYTVTAP